MAVSMTLRNTFLEIADAPMKRRARASSSPLLEDSCGETTLPSDDSDESCDERAEPSRTEPLCSRSAAWGATPALGAAPSPMLCPWPSTPEFLPQYKIAEPKLLLPPCAEEDALLPPSFESPEEMDAALWNLAWYQMCWSQDNSGWFDLPAMQDPQIAPADEPQADSPQEMAVSWADEPVSDSPQDRAVILPHQTKQPAKSDVPRTTVMLKNMPNNQNRKMLLELLDREGFALSYDFVYLPADFKTSASLGYAFVNFITPEIALRAFETFDGFSRWSIPSRKVCGVGWSGPHQGLVAHVERYRDSPVMHHEVPEKFKPMLLKNGVAVPFPPPTKKLRAPRLRGLA